MKTEFEKWCDNYLNNPAADDDGLTIHLKRAWQAALAVQREKDVRKIRKLKYSSKEVMEHEDFQRFRTYNNAIEHAAKELEAAP